MRLPDEEEELRAYVFDHRIRLLELEDRVRRGDKSAFKALKIVRKDYNGLLKELRQRCRHVRDEEHRDMLEALLTQAEVDGATSDELSP